MVRRHGLLPIALIYLDQVDLLAMNLHSVCKSNSDCTRFIFARLPNRSDDCRWLCRSWAISLILKSVFVIKIGVIPDFCHDVSECTPLRQKRMVCGKLSFSAARGSEISKDEGMQSPGRKPGRILIELVVADSWRRGLVREAADDPKPT